MTASTTEGNPRAPAELDDLSAFCLRTSVSSVSILPLWASMQRLGWSHSATTRMYRAPPTTRRNPSAAVAGGSGSEAISCTNGGEWEQEQVLGEVVGDSLAVGEALDRRSILTDNWSTASPPADGSALDEDGSDRQRRIWRDELLGNYYKHRKDKGSSVGMQTLFSMDDSPEKTDEGSKMKSRTAKSPGRELRKRKTPASAATASLSSGKCVGVSRHRKNSCEYQSKRTEPAEEAVSQNEIDQKSEVANAAGPDRPTWPEPDECVEAVRSIIETDGTNISGPTRISMQVDLAVEAQRGKFSEWSFLLSTGHSILLYGFGSKRAVLDAFRVETLSTEGELIVVNGYDRSTTIDVVLDALVRRFLGGAEPSPVSDASAVAAGIPPVAGRSLQAVRRATAIALAISSSSSSSMIPPRPQPSGCARVPPAAFLVLHNIEGLSTAEAQGALAALVSRGGGAIRIVASVDHVKAAAVLWDWDTSVKFSWIWEEIHTQLPYLEEVRLGAATTTRKVRFGSAQLSDHGGILNVLSAIAPRHTECLQVLANLQRCLGGRSALGGGGGGGGRNKSRDGREAAVMYKDWMERCKSEMKVHGDHALREILRELTDHGVVEKSRDDATEMVRIPHADGVLNLILNFKRNA